MDKVQLIFDRVVCLEELYCYYYYTAVGSGQSMAAIDTIILYSSKYTTLTYRSTLTANAVAWHTNYIHLRKNTVVALLACSFVLHTEY